MADKHRLAILSLHRPSALQEAAVLAAIVAALTVWRWSAIAQIGAGFLGGWERDAGLYIWLSRIAVDGLAPGGWFETPAFYPYGHSLAWSDNFLLPSLLAGALVSAGLSLPAAYNLVMLGACAMTGYLTYHLAFLVSGALAPAIFAGTGMLFSSYLSGHLGHPQLQYAAIIPLCLVLLLTHLESSRPLPALLCGLSLFMGFLSGVNQTIIALLCLTLAWAGAACLRPELLAPRRLIRLWLPFCAGLSPILPFLGPYLDVRSAFGEREIYEAYYFSANVLSYLSASPLNLMYGWSSVLSHSEANLFSSGSLYLCGAISFFVLLPRGAARTALLVALCVAATAALPPFGLKSAAAAGTWIACAAAIWVLCKIRAQSSGGPLDERELGAIFLLCSLVIFLISLGPLGVPEKGEPAISLFRLFYAIFPGFNSIRAVGRIGIGCILFLYLASVMCLRILRSRSVIGIGLIAACLLENLCPAYPFESEPPRPAAFDALCREADSGAAIALPLSAGLDDRRQVASWGEYARLNVAYMNWSAGCGLRLVNGYSGQRSRLMLELPARLRGFPDDRSLAALGEIAGLEYIVGTPLGAGAQSDPPSSPALQTIGKFPDGSYLMRFRPHLALSRTRTVYAPPGARRLSLLIEAPQDAQIELEIWDPNADEVARRETRVVAAGWSLLALELPELRHKVRPNRVTLAANGDAAKSVALAGSRVEF